MILTSGRCVRRSAKKPCNCGLIEWKEQKLREYEELNESKKLEKAGLKLANLEKVPTTLPENNRPVACTTAGGATGVQTVAKAKMTPETHHQL